MTKEKVEELCDAICGLVCLAEESCDDEEFRHLEECGVEIMRFLNAQNDVKDIYKTLYEQLKAENVELKEKLSKDM